jgi:hypothetical protein
LSEQQHFREATAMSVDKWAGYLGAGMFVKWQRGKFEGRLYGIGTQERIGWL